jgi:hypothetical protein
MFFGRFAPLFVVGEFTSMTGHRPFDVKTYLADAVRQYLLQKPSDRISEDDQLRVVCNRLAPLLSEVLKGANGWDRYKWVDVISPCTANSVTESDLELSGLVIWGTRGNSKEWIDPLWASIRLLDRSSETLGYELRFGNADRGLGRCPRVSARLPDCGKNTPLRAGFGSNSGRRGRPQQLCVFEALLKPVGK